MSPALFQLAAPSSERNVLSLYCSLSTLCPLRTGAGFGCGSSPCCLRLTVQVQTALVSPVPVPRDPPRPLPGLSAVRAHRGDSEPRAALSPDCDTTSKGSVPFQGGPAATPKSTYKPRTQEVPAPCQEGTGQGPATARWDPATNATSTTPACMQRTQAQALGLLQSLLLLQKTGSM